MNYQLKTLLNPQLQLQLRYIYASNTKSRHWFNYDLAKDGMNLYVPAGNFLMGSAHSILMHNHDEKPQHTFTWMPFGLTKPM